MTKLNQLCFRVFHALRRRGVSLGARIAAQGLPWNVSQRVLIKLRNRHAGRRAFIIGNGPSLRVEDLDRLKDEITFASNKIYLAYDQTAWRPSYYVVVDRLVAQNNAEAIAKQPGRKFMSDDVRPFISDCPGAIWLHERFDNSRLQLLPDARQAPVSSCRFSKNIVAGVHGGGSVVFTQLQMAYYMGITEAILLGVDFSFSLPNKRTGDSVYGAALKSEGEVNHFHRDYRKQGEQWSIPRLDVQEVAFAAARQIYERNGRKILNASRSTKLTVIKRQDFDALF
jgi:hypothetical protein